MVEQFSRNCLDKIRHADIMMDRWTETGGVYLHKKSKQTYKAHHNYSVMFPAHNDSTMC